MFKIISSTYLSDHPYFTARKDSYETASGKVVDPYFVVELPSSVVAMAVTEDWKIILLKQYRHPVAAEMLELPGGFIDHNEQPHSAVGRELKEETGYEFSNIQYLGITAGNPGVLNNYSHMFLALGGKKTGNQELDHNEEIALSLHDPSEVWSMLLHHEIPQSMHALTLFYGFRFLEQNGLYTVK